MTANLLFATIWEGGRETVVIIEVLHLNHTENVDQHQS